MGITELSETETLEVENALIRELHQQERIAHAATNLKLQQELQAHVHKEKELLFLRLLTKYGLEGYKGLRFSPDGKSIEWQDPPTNPKAPFFNPPPPPNAPTPPAPPTLEVSPGGNGSEPPARSRRGK